jgi:hypothetical protein
VSLGRYAVVVLGAVAGSLGLWWLIAGRSRGGEELAAVAVGAALAAVNTTVAHALVLWSQPRSTNAFLGAVLGGMVGRMGLMLVAVVAAVLGLGLPKVPLAVSLLGHFVAFLVLELTILHRRTLSRVEAVR